MGAVLGFDGRDVVVRSVLDGSPARRAGLRRGDRLLMINGEFVRTPVVARTKLYWLEPGTSATLTIKRGDAKPLQLTVKVSDWRSVSKLTRWEGAPLKAGGKAPAWWAEKWDIGNADVLPTPKNTRGKVVCLMVFQAL